MIEKLPKQWCIKVEEDNTPIEVLKWRIYDKDRRGSGIWNCNGWIDNTGYCSSYLPLDCDEISLNDFKRLVLNQPPDNYNYLITLLKNLNIK